MEVLTTEKRDAIDNFVVQLVRDILKDVDKENIEDCLYELAAYLSDFWINESGVELPNGHLHHIDTLISNG